MLQVKNICKEYRTGGLTQRALDDVSLNLRENEFVAILGPSGSGKTTLLNIIGGLDRYDSGDLIINGISTKEYRDRDWDSYRNHTVGFVFQSYNLIPHQTVLANVELALTISGIGSAERKARAKAALEQVGLGNQLHKKPGQMSGGQMQRVAIARALVNDPDILLADEPTGALDSDTSIQVMELLKEVAKDRLVVMVTHNPELAEAYATRIVKLKDGKIRWDSDPYTPAEQETPPVHKNMGKAVMSLFTALSLSFANLKTKKTRTLITALAGSIGIIGIALILSLSTGANQYIASVERDALSGYPLEITGTGLNMASMMMSREEFRQEPQEGEINVARMMEGMFSGMDANDLASLKAWLDSGDSGMEPYVNAIEYSYDVAPQIYSFDGEKARQVNPDSTFSSIGFGSSASSNPLVSTMMSTDVFYSLPQTKALYQEQYEIKAGRWPENAQELVLVLYDGGRVSDFVLYTLGLRDSVELEEMVRQFAAGEDVDTPEILDSYPYERVLGTTYRLVNAANYYEYDENYKVWTDKTDNPEYVKKLVSQGETLTIVGIAQAKEGASAANLRSGIYYTPELTAHVMEKAAQSEIVQSQLENPSINVITGEPFGAQEGEKGFDMTSLVTVDEDKLAEAFDFDTSAMEQAFSGGLDLSGAFSMEDLDLEKVVDLSQISISLPDLPQLSLGDLPISPDFSKVDVGALASQILQGFGTYVKEHTPEDLGNFPAHFQEYLRSEEARTIFKEEILDVLAEGNHVTVSPESLRELAQTILKDYMDYIAQAGEPQEGEELACLEAYLDSGRAQALLQAWISENIQIDPDVEITPEQLERLAARLMEGYTQYAKDQGYADISQLGTLFSEYLKTEAAQAIMAQALGNLVDMNALEQALGGYMTQIFSAYGETLEAQISAAMGQVMNQVLSRLSWELQGAMEASFRNIGDTLQASMGIDSEAFLNAFSFNMDGGDLKDLLLSLAAGAGTTYERNLAAFGYGDFGEPSQIDIYATDFESKQMVETLLDDYNARMAAEGKEEQVISYSDMVGAMMASVTTIVDIISYVLVAFVAISLVVSSIMIGVITYISVLERRKEIGILRAIGASKRNISQVFNAETFIIGLCAGILGIGITLLLILPLNAIIHGLSGVRDINAVLPMGAAVILVILSVVLTLLGGLIPAKKAAKSDPVAALRSE